MPSRAVRNVERFIYIVFPIVLLIGNGDVTAESVKNMPGHLTTSTAVPHTAQTHLPISTFHFETDSHQLHPAFEQVLQQHVDYLLYNRRQILVIHGHADERGTERYNMELSEQRANHVKQFFIDRGVNVSQLVTQAHGEHQAVSQSRQHNRRVELKYDTIMLLSAW